MFPVQALKRYLSRLGSQRMAGLIAIAILAGCGEQSSTVTPKDSLRETGASPTVQCFFAGKVLGENDMNLFAATAAGDVVRIAQLIEAGANVNAADSLQRTPLFAAVFCNHPQAANLLIDKGGDFNAKDFGGMSPLHAAVVVGAVDVARTLIEKKANLDIRDAAGRTPLHLAAATDQMGMLELLLEHGANARVRDKDGNPAAFLASENGHAKVAVALKKWQERQKVQGQKQG